LNRTSYALVSVRTFAIPERFAKAATLRPSAGTSMSLPVYEPTSYSDAQSLTWNARRTFGAYTSRRCSRARLNPR